MAGSSFCCVIISLNNGKSIKWIGEDGDTPLFRVPSNARKLLMKVASVEDLVSFLITCAAVDQGPEYASEVYRDCCKNFDAELRQVKNFSDIVSLEVSWGEYDPHDGEPPEFGCDGASVTFDFGTKKSKTSRKPDEEFVSFMIDIYSDMFD